MRVRYKNKTVVVRVSLIDGVKWKWVVDEALRLFKASIVMGKLHASAILSPTHEVLDLDQRILYYDVISMIQHPGEFLLIAEGPLLKLEDKFLLRVHSYLRTIGDTHALLCVSRRFRKIFTRDDVWRHIHFQVCAWLGIGDAGSEQAIWKKIQDDAGIGQLYSYRLRWMSHNTSRLKLYYGSIKPSFLSYLASTMSSTPNRTVLVLGQNETSRIKSFMSRLHFLIPESATQFHNSWRYTPILKPGFLTEVEPSPRNSRSRNHQMDPGTLLECSCNNTSFTYRRIGDHRLTFIGMNPPARKDLPLFDYFSYYELTKKVSFYAHQFL